jgi:hypothetical protein
MIAMAMSCCAAQAAGSVSDALALAPLEWEFNDITLRLGGFAGGALFSAQQSAGPLFPEGSDRSGASGEARATIRAQRIFDSGMVLGVGSDFLLYHDQLSGDQYDNDTVEKLYLFAQTGFGRFELGEQDGAAFTLGLTGPVTNGEVTLENPNITLFRNPVTGERFANFFESVTAVQSTSNYAKINYLSPRLLGIQIGASFTPQALRAPLPFTGNPRNTPDQQQNIWEVAGGYTGYFSDIAAGFSLGYAQGSLKNRTPGTDNLYDFAAGAQFQYSLSDVKLSLGGGYRDTNAHLFDIEQVFVAGKTRASHISGTAEWGSWIAGAEYSIADIKGPTAYDVIGYQLSAGYRLNDNLQITGGWQWYDFARSIGAFHNGLPRINMNAGFLLLTYGL